jgi:hypothetical protein
MSQLANLLANLIPDPDRIRLLLRDGTGLDPAEVAFQGGASLVWGRVLELAWMRGRLDRVVEAVVTIYPERRAHLNAQMLRFKAGWGTFPGLGDPYQFSGPSLTIALENCPPDGYAIQPWVHAEEMPDGYLLE